MTDTIAKIMKTGCAWIVALVLLGLVPASARAHGPDCCGTKVSYQEKEAMLCQFHTENLRAGQTSFRVLMPNETYGRRDLPPVLICEELFTVSAELLALAQRVAHQGYAVYLPVLFGDEHEDPNSNLLGLTRVADFTFARPAWRANDSASTRQIIRDIDALCRESILPRHPHRKLGVIGLCLTGIFPVELLGQPDSMPGLSACVVSEPSIPLVTLTDSRRRSLGISDEELQRARARVRAQRLQILGFRFELDCISPPERFTRLRHEFGSVELGSREPGFIDATLLAKDYVDRDCYPKNAHAVLTKGYCRPTANKPETSGHSAYRQMVWYLDRKLKGVESSPPVRSVR